MRAQRFRGIPTGRCPLGACLPLLGAAVALTTVPVTAVVVPKAWVPTQTSLSTGRELHTATTLANGKVLVTGGQNGGTLLSSTELYDPVADTWTIKASMTSARAGHTATLLSPAACSGGAPPGYCGKVLVAGGGTTPEVYDPNADTWTATGAFPAGDDPGSHFTATLLNPSTCAGGSPPSYCGKVLVAGGDAGLGTKKALLYDPGANSWASTGDMTTIRFAHAAVLLGSGKVLVAGGYTYNFLGRETTAELYDPGAGTWAATAPLPSDPMPLPAFTYGPTYATATLLAGGQALLAGGEVCSGPSCGGSSVSERAALYDPSSGTWTFTASMTVARSHHGANLVADGVVLVEGGSTALPSVLSRTNTAEAYRPASTTPAAWLPAAPMTTPRTRHASAKLSDGSVLAVGGSAPAADPTGSVISTQDQSSAERYTP